MKSCLSSLVCIFIFQALPVCAQEKTLAILTVESGESPCFDTPVCAQLNWLSDLDPHTLCLYENRGDSISQVPIQIEMDSVPKLWWILKGGSPAGNRRTFELVQGSMASPSPAITCQVDSAVLTIQQHGVNVLQYRHAILDPPPGTSELFRRSGFIHPLWSPEGFVLTNIHPADHIHHLGIWNPWTRVVVDGKNVDFWNLGDGQGSVRFVKFLSTFTGQVFGGFQALHQHVAFFPEGESTAIEEEWDVRVWNVSADNRLWLWELSSTLYCAADSAILFEAYRYGGGLGFRASAEWTKDNSMILTSEGLARDQADGSRARWCIVAGKEQEKDETAAVLFMSHPDNYEHPEPMRVWPSDGNSGRGDVFFEFCPIRHNSMTLEPGRKTRFKYRMVVCDGSLSADEAQRYWIDFAFPPRIIVEKKL